MTRFIFIAICALVLFFNSMLIAQQEARSDSSTIVVKIAELEKTLAKHDGDIQKLKATHSKSLFNRILPIITFIGGFLLSLLQQFHERHRERLNIRFILSREVREIYRSLNRVINPDNRIDMGVIQVIALMGSRISTKAYDEYFGRISILKPAFTKQLFDSYIKTYELIQLSKEFMEATASNKAKHDEISARAAVLSTSLQPTYEKIKELLCEFRNGNKIIEELKNEQGQAIAAFHEMRDL